MTNEGLAQRFHARFRGLERVYGTYVVDHVEGLKRKGRAMTIVGVVTDLLWQSHLEGIQGLGIIPINDMSECRWGAIDIDVYQGLDHAAVAAKIKEHRLPLVMCTTKSGGLHLFLFVKDPVPAELVRDRLSQWAFLLGFPTAEVFPKQVQLASRDDVGSWLNMPYFDAEKSTRRCLVEGEPVGPEQFLVIADATAVTRTFLEEYRLMTDPLLEGAPPCLQYLCGFGIPEGGRNNGLFQLGVYARKRWADEWEDRLRELNERFISPPLVTRELEILIKSLRRKEYAYKCKDQPMKGACAKALCMKSQYGLTDMAAGPGVVIRDLVKYDTRPPVWFLTIEEKRVCLSSTRVLLEQQLFEQLCVDEVNLVPHRMKSEQWRELVQGLLNAVEVVDVPDDAGVDGVLFDMAEAFCTESPRGSGPEDLLHGAVCRVGEVWQFRSRDFLKYLEINKFPHREPNKVWARLKGLGGEAGVVEANGKRIRYWCLPAGLFTEEAGARSPRIAQKNF